MADPAPTTLFNSYEQELTAILSSIKDKLERDANQQGGKWKVELDLDEADDIVAQLEIEIQGIPQSIKSQYLPRLKQAKSDLQKYKKQAKDLHGLLNRSDLLGRFTPGGRAGGPSPAASDDPYGEGSDRVRLLVGNQVLTDGSRRLADSTRVALQTEQQGADILRTLRGQREQIEHARDTLQSADVHVDRASGTLKRMIVQMYRQRFVMGAILAFFIVLVLVILYFKFVRR
ncbi:hypothetical protein AX16_005816 [Volvariella volvacea WC 439]|nr:hypothetical protein AX16_005816 [Volvariella volvacea WC 439]